jgi:hypothetical protein
MVQLLAAPVLEGALAGVDAVLDVSVEVVEVEVDSVFGLLSLALEAVLSAGALAPPVLLYRSAYQPPPLRMKPAPPEIWRLALAWWQLGHSVSGAALMDCSASQAWPQAVQAYS